LRRALVLLTIALLGAAGAMLGAAAKKGAPARKGASSTAANKSAASAKKGTPAAKKSGAGTKGAAASNGAASRKTTASRRKKGRGRARQSAQTWRSRQLVPTPERYTAIQEALIRKGYLQGIATGQWDQASADALRRFQQDQNLEPSGKLNSLSLIALGLGPKYDSTTAAAPPPSLPPQRPN